jgi:hypothetical protein
MSGGTRPDDINTYSAVLGERPYSIEEWESGVRYEHRYGDGALTCVRKALEAIENKDELPQLKVDLNKATHHCGYDFEIWKPTAVCRCGAIATNPFYVGSKDD